MAPFSSTSTMRPEPVPIPWVSQWEYPVLSMLEGHPHEFGREGPTSRSHLRRAANAIVAGELQRCD